MVGEIIKLSRRLSIDICYFLRCTSDGKVPESIEATGSTSDTLDEGILLGLVLNLVGNFVINKANVSFCRLTEA